MSDVVIVLDSLVLLYKRAYAHFKNQNYEQAFRLFTATANRGFAKAQYTMWCMFDATKNDETKTEDENKSLYQAFSARVNFREALNFLKLAAYQGYPEAQYKLGCMYYEGRIEDDVEVIQNYSEALRWFRLAASQNNVEAHFEIWSMHEASIDLPNRPEFIEAFISLNIAANKGHAKAQNKLGSVYYTGQAVVEQNYGEAIKWFRFAAKQGVVEAQFNIWVMYISDNLPRSELTLTESLTFLEAAQQGNDAEAQYQLGCTYYLGEGDEVKPNYIKAIKYLRLAAAQDHSGAKFAIWDMYEERKLFTSLLDFNEAFAFLNSAADQRLQQAVKALKRVNKSNRSAVVSSTASTSSSALSIEAPKPILFGDAAASAQQPGTEEEQLEIARVLSGQEALAQGSGGSITSDRR